MSIWATKVNIAAPSMPDNGLNMWHMREDTGLFPDDQAAIEQGMTYIHSFYTAIAGVYTPATTLSWDGTAVQVGDPEPELRAGMTPWSVTGTGGADTMPPADQMVVTWRSSVATRSGRGRTFLGPLSLDNLQDNGTPEESAREAVRIAAANLIDAFDDVDAAALGLCVWSVKDGIARDIISATVPNKFAVLRSRRD